MTPDTDPDIESEHAFDLERIAEADQFINDEERESAEREQRIASVDLATQTLRAPGAPKPLPVAYLYRRGVLTTDEFLAGGGSLDDPYLKVACGCESALCDHTNPANPDGTLADLPYVLPCNRVPTGLTKMTFVGDVCETCATNMIRSGGASNIERVG